MLRFFSLLSPLSRLSTAWLHTFIPVITMVSQADSKPHVQEVMDAEHEKVVGNVKEISTASVALASAVASQKPNPWSRNMLKLYAIMGVGYVVSTMNGFGKLSLGKCLSP